MLLRQTKGAVLNPVLLDAFKQHQQALLGFLNKRLGDEQSAQDLLHDLYLKIESQAGDKTIAYPKAYLFRIANNLAIDLQRRKSNQVEHQGIEENTLISEVSPEHALRQQQQLAIVTQAINELPDKTRDAFKMQRIQQIEKNEVAEKLGISVNMVEKHLRRAVQYCREKLKSAEN